MIAEIGCNHRGELDVAREMILQSGLFCRVDAVKFQKRTVKELLTPEEYNAPHPNPGNAFGETYGAHREFLEFNLEQHRQLQRWAAEFGVVYSSSVWDLTAAREIASLQPAFIKIPSACNQDFGLLGWLCENYPGAIHISLGMTRRDEEDRLVGFLMDRKRAQDCILYACTSGYPVPFEDICLLEVSRLKEKFGGGVKGIGFSGHHLGIAADIAAMALGAKYFERHFTLDRTWKGTDQAASLEPDGMRRLARDLKNVSLAMKLKEQEILPIEEAQRRKLKRKVP